MTGAPVVQRAHAMFFLPMPGEDAVADVTATASAAAGSCPSRVRPCSVCCPPACLPSCLAADAACLPCVAGGMASLVGDCPLHACMQALVAAYLAAVGAAASLHSGTTATSCSWEPQLATDAGSENSAQRTPWQGCNSSTNQAAACAAWGVGFCGLLYARMWLHKCKSVPKSVPAHNARMQGTKPSPLVHISSARVRRQQQDWGEAAGSVPQAR